MNAHSHRLPESLRRLGVALVAALCASLIAPSAGAQTRAGLPLEGLAPEGLVVARVLAPDSVDAPVRLALSTAQGAHRFTVDVWVRGSSASARALAAETAPTLSSEGMEATAGLGDVAWRGAERVVAFARYNVFVVITASDDANASDLAAHLDALIRRAPASAAAAPQVDVSIPSHVGSRTLAVPSEIAAMSVVVSSGPASARRVPSGWLLTRTALGDVRVSAIVVDAYLRARAQ